MNPDRLAELEDERRFLLRSLRDLDAELAAGDVDDGDYETLRDGYTRRAADVLREIDDARAALPARRAVRWRRRVAAVAAVLAVAVASGWLVARSSGQRLDDGVVASGGEDVAVLLATARSLFATDPAGAQALYRQVLEQRPDQPEALAYSGFLLFAASDGAREDLRVEAVRTAEEQLARAVAADPTYADPHCFSAIVAADAGDEERATAERERCLSLDPPADLRTLVTAAVPG